MLRASSQAREDGGKSAVDLDPITRGAAAGSGGVAHGELLVELAEAAVSLDPERLPAARQRVLEEVGAEPLVDAAGVIGNFQRMVRVADATGIPLDDIMLQISQDFRSELGLEGFAGAENTRELGLFKRALSGVTRRAFLKRIRRSRQQKPRSSMRSS